MFCIFLCFFVCDFIEIIPRYSVDMLPIISKWKKTIACLKRKYMCWLCTHSGMCDNAAAKFNINK